MVNDKFCLEPLGGETTVAVDHCRGSPSGGGRCFRRRIGASRSACDRTRLMKLTFGLGISRAAEQLPERGYDN